MLGFVDICKKIIPLELPLLAYLLLHDFLIASCFYLKHYNNSFDKLFHWIDSMTPTCENFQLRAALSFF